MGELKAAARRLAARTRGLPDRPSDLIQGTLAVIIKQESEGRESVRSVGEMRSRILGIMVNVQRRAWKRRRPAVGLEADRHASAAASPSEEAIYREQVERLEVALRRVDEADRQLFRWIHEENLSYSKVGERLGISKQAARIRHARAVDRLRAAFERGDAAGLGPDAARPRQAGRGDQAGT